MKLLSYKEIIGKTKEKVDELMGPLRIARMEMQAECEMLKIDEEILTLEAKVQEICIQYPIEFGDLIDVLDDIAIKERRKEQYKNIIEKLFYDEDEK